MIPGRIFELIEYSVYDDVIVSLRLLLIDFKNSNRLYNIRVYQTANLKNIYRRGSYATLTVETVYRDKDSCKHIYLFIINKIAWREKSGHLPGIAPLPFKGM